MDLTRDIMCSQWINDINTYKYKSMTFWIYKSQLKENTWFMSNFNFNLTDIDLKTPELEIALNRSHIILNTKYTRLDSAISTLSKLTKRVKRKSIRISPRINENLIQLAENVKNI